MFYKIICFFKNNILIYLPHDKILLWLRQNLRLEQTIKSVPLLITSYRKLVRPSQGILANMFPWNICSCSHILPNAWEGRTSESFRPNTSDQVSLNDCKVYGWSTEMHGADVYFSEKGWNKCICKQVNKWINKMPIVTHFSSLAHSL